MSSDDGASPAARSEPEPLLANRANPDQFGPDVDGALAAEQALEPEGRLDDRRANTAGYEVRDRPPLADSPGRLLSVTSEGEFPAVDGGGTPQSSPDCALRFQVPFAVFAEASTATVAVYPPPPSDQVPFARG